MHWAVGLGNRLVRWFFDGRWGLFAGRNWDWWRIFIAAKMRG